jgi:hypothetical protein
VQVSPRDQDIVEGTTVVDKYYYCDGLQANGYLQEQTQEEWFKMKKMWLVNTQGILVMCSLCCCLLQSVFAAYFDWSCRSHLLYS